MSYKYNKGTHCVDEQPTMEKPESIRKNHYLLLQYEKHIASLRRIPVPEEYRGIWKHGEDVTGKFKEGLQIFQGKYSIPFWQDVDQDDYDREYRQEKRIVAIPILKQEQPQTDKVIPEPFSGWLKDLNSCLNVLQHHNYDDLSRGYAENVHQSYHKRFKEWNET